MTFDFNKLVTIGFDKWKTAPFRFYGEKEPFFIGNKIEQNWRDVILSGNTALTLVNSKANGLNYVKLFGATEQVPQEYVDSLTLEGKCEQSGTPTPDNPIPIWCNNGTVKCNTNIFTTTGATQDKYIDVNGQEQNGVYQGYSFAHTNYLKVKPNTTYTVSGVSKVTLVTNHWVSAWSSNKTFIGRLVNLAFPSNSIGNEYSVTFTTTAETEYIMFNYVYTVDEEIKIYLNAYSLNEIYADGIQETVEVDTTGDTATAEMLLSVGDYKDTQEILGGNVTRNIGVMVLDGSIEWTYKSLGSGIARVYIRPTRPGDTDLALCSHAALTSVSERTRARDSNTFQFGILSSSNEPYLGFKLNESEFADATAWKQYLADQYANGTPIIIVYPLETATEETVTPQPLSFPKDYVLTVTGSLDDLVVTVDKSIHTTPTPTQPLDIICNNGVLKAGNIYNFATNSALFNSNNGCGWYIDTSNNILRLGASSNNATWAIPCKPNTDYTISYVKGDIANTILRLGWISPPDLSFVDTSVSQPCTCVLGVDDGTRFTATIKTGSQATYIVVQVGFTAYHAGDIRSVLNLVIGNTIGSIYTDGTVETVEAHSKNLFTGLISQFTNQGGIGTTYDYFKLPKENTNYTISCICKKDYTGSASVFFGFSGNGGDANNSVVWAVSAKMSSNKGDVITVNNIFSGRILNFVSIYLKGQATLDTLAEYFDIQLEEGSTATAYETYYYGGSATAEMLLNAGDYKDEQNITTGVITRNVGIKVLDGTENWSIADDDCFSSPISDKLSDSGIIPISTHFKSATQTGTFSVPDNGIGASSNIGNKQVWIKMTSIPSVNNFKVYLADQYANGTPVIIVYPLAGPTTETVTPQPLSIQAGTNIITAEGSIDNLELEVSYKAGVSVTITEVQNAQLDNNVEVTING